MRKFGARLSTHEYARAGWEKCWNLKLVAGGNLRRAGVDRVPVSIG